MERSDTIAAIATPLGESGIGTVRLSGPQARPIADRVFRAADGKPLTERGGYRAAYGKVSDAAGPIDEAVALLFVSPKSYTGEDVVELSIHGGRFVLKKLLRAVLDAGARPAGPGEFTRRAYQNGKLDLMQAESVMGLIGANGEQALRMALAAREGAPSRQISAVRQILLDVAANIAAYSDDPDDDFPALTDEQLGGSLAEAERLLDTLLQSYDAGRAIREGVDTVIVGAPNVGKSTLMNLLSGAERSIVTPLAGTTRDVIEDMVFVGEIPLRLADTAGLRQTDDAVEAAGVRLAERRLEQAQLVLAVFDASRPPDAQDTALLERLRGRPCVLIWNKTDLAAGNPPAPPAGWAGPVVPLCAKTGEGLEKLTRAIAEVTGAAALDPGAAVLCSERQRDCCVQARHAVREAADALRAGMTLDAVEVCVEDALDALLSLLGERVTDAVTDRVFERFCVGK